MSPEIICSARIANTKKKKIRIINVSLSRGKAEIRAETRIFKPSMLLIVLSGLRILKALNTLSFMLSVSIRIVILI